MPIVPIYLDIDDQTYSAVLSGAVELCGMAKAVDTKRVVKHIPTIVDKTKESSAQAIDFVREHKKGALVAGGILIVGSAAAGAVGYIKQRKQRKLEAQFGKALQDYLEAAKSGELTLETLNTLINAIEAIEQNHPDENVKLNIPAAQFNDLVQCIFDYTLRLAEANNFNKKSIHRPTPFKKTTLHNRFEVLSEYAKANLRTSSIKEIAI